MVLWVRKAHDSKTLLDYMNLLLIYLKITGSNEEDHENPLQFHIFQMKVNSNVTI